MNALWRPEAKSNRALFNVIDLTCRYIETLAQQGLRTPGAFVLDAQDVDLAIPDAAGHIGVVSIGGQQPAGDALGQLQQILRRVDRLAHRLLESVGKLQNLWRCAGEVVLAEDRNPGQQLPAGKPALHALPNLRVVVG